LSSIPVRKPAEENTHKGYVNARGGYQPPDHEIDLVDIPEMTPSKLETDLCGPIETLIPILWARRAERQLGKLPESY
jgi:hypothetical protein